MLRACPATLSADPQDVSGEGELTMFTAGSGMDVLIRGARVIDGTGNPWFHGDLAIAGDRVAAITRPGAIPSARVMVA